MTPAKSLQLQLCTPDTTLFSRYYREPLNALMLMMNAPIPTDTTFLSRYYRESDVLLVDNRDTHRSVYQPIIPNHETIRPDA